MPTVDEVLAGFALFAEMEAADARLWERLCVAALAEIGARLRAGVDPAMHRERIATAAAGIAYAAYCGVIARGGAAHAGAAREIRVGEVSLRGGDADAAELRQWFLAEIADLLGIGRFAFVATGG